MKNYIKLYKNYTKTIQKLYKNYTKTLKNLYKIYKTYTKTIKTHIKTMKIIYKTPQKARFRPLFPQNPRFSAVSGGPNGRVHGSARFTAQFVAFLL
jgi:hypothetical protein